MMTDQYTGLQNLGHAHVAPARLAEIVAASLATESATLIDVEVQVVDYPIFSIATGALLRVRGTASTDDGSVLPFRIFVKQLHSALHWPFLEVVVPQDQRAMWASQFPWEIELDAFRSTIADVLPEGMRLPDLYAIEEIGETRAAIWMEDVDADDARWSIDRYRRAAFLLGVLAGRRPIGSSVRFGRRPDQAVPGYAIGKYIDTRVRLGSIPLLYDDETWAHPALTATLAAVGEEGIRDEVIARVALLDGLQDEMNALPQTYVHGDASPHNLLVPRDDPETFVVIDWGFDSPHCVGFDLGQLLMGMANPGIISAADLPGLFDVILDSYVDGLRTTGFTAERAQVRRGFVASLIARDLYSTIPLEQLGQPDTPALRALLANRLRMARFLLDLADEL